MKPRFKLLVLRAANVAKTRGFYACIGLDLQLEQHGTGPEHYACEMADFVLEIYPSRATETGHAEEMLGFEVASIDPILERLAAMGILPLRPPVMNAQGLRVLVADPDGRRAEPIEPR